MSEPEGFDGAVAQLDQMEAELADLRRRIGLVLAATLAVGVIAYTFAAMRPA